MNRDIRTIKDMFIQFKYIFNPKQKRNSILIFIAILIGAAFETLGVSAIIPFMQAIVSPEELMKNKYVAYTMDWFGLDTSLSLIILMGAGIILVYIAKNLYLTISAYAQIRFRCNFQKSLSVYILQSYMKRPYTYFLNINSANIIRGITNDTNGVFQLLDCVFKFSAEALTVLLIGIFIIATEPIMASGILILACSCFVIVTLVFRNSMKILGAKQRIYNAERTKNAYQAINGIKEIIVMRKEDLFTEKYEKSYQKQVKTDIGQAFAMACPERIIEAICIGGLIGVVCIRITMGVDSASFVPQLGAFAVAAFRILPSVARMTGYVSSIIFYRPTLEETYHNLVEVKTYETNKEAYNRLHSNKEDNYNISLTGFQEKVCLQEIYWKYPNVEDYVLKGADLVIAKGESVAFIGESGAGKTTLADILLGLLQPQKGSVKMDGIDIFTIPNEWSKIIGYVPQSVFLIDDTIRNNVSFGIAEEDIKEDMIWHALEKAQLKSFVENLPQGLDTIVGERGIKFSGGQRQRVSIARALYYNPEILVLDEATAALDNETETAIMEAIDALQGEKTLIIVAHRLTTIRNCDSIYEIVNGKIVKRNKQEVLDKLLEMTEKH